MSKMTNQDYLKGNQYKNPNKLESRLNLHQKFSTNLYGFHRWTFDQYNFTHNLSVLEVGCGSGELWLKNRERIPTFKRVVLSDNSQGMIESVKKSLSSVLQDKTEFAIFDVQQIPFEDNSFDLIIANHMLYHVPSVSKAISEIYRVLNVGGSFFASTNGRNHMIELDNLMKEFDDFYENIRYDDLNFMLENGLEKVKMFSSYKILRYEDSLKVTNAKDLVSYQISRMENSETLKTEQGQKCLFNFFNTIIEEKGYIEITKDAGIIVAYK